MMDYERLGLLMQTFRERTGVEKREDIYEHLKLAEFNLEDAITLYLDTLQEKLNSNVEPQDNEESDDSVVIIGVGYHDVDADDEEEEAPLEAVPTVAALPVQASPARSPTPELIPTPNSATPEMSPSPQSSPLSPSIRSNDDVEGEEDDQQPEDEQEEEQEEEEEGSEEEPPLYQRDQRERPTRGVVAVDGNERPQYSYEKMRKLKDELEEMLTELRETLADKRGMTNLQRVLKNNEIAKMAITLDVPGWGESVDDLAAIMKDDNRCSEFGAPILAAYRSFRVRTALMKDVPAEVSPEEVEEFKELYESESESSSSEDESEEEESSSEDEPVKKAAKRKPAGAAARAVNKKKTPATSPASAKKRSAKKVESDQEQDRPLYRKGTAAKKNVANPIDTLAGNKSYLMKATMGKPPKKTTAAKKAVAAASASKKPLPAAKKAVPKPSAKKAPAASPKAKSAAAVAAKTTTSSKAKAVAPAPKRAAKAAPQPAPKRGAKAPAKPSAKRVVGKKANRGVREEDASSSSEEEAAPPVPTRKVGGKGSRTKHQAIVVEPMYSQRRGSEMAGSPKSLEPGSAKRKLQYDSDSSVGDMDAAVDDEWEFPEASAADENSIANLQADDSSQSMHGFCTTRQAPAARFLLMDGDDSFAQLPAAPEEDEQHLGRVATHQPAPRALAEDDIGALDATEEETPNRMSQQPLQMQQNNNNNNNNNADVPLADRPPTEGKAFLSAMGSESSMKGGGSDPAMEHQIDGASPIQTH